MKIAVCVKPIKTDLVYPNEGRKEACVINPYDLFALENALELKKRAGCELICICMGAMSAQYLMTKMLAMGADDAVLLSDSAFAGSDTVATSYILAKAIRAIGDVDMVICGERSIDGETGQVAYGLGEELEIQCIPRAEKFLEADGRFAIIEQRGRRMINKVRFSLPAVISFCDFQLRQPDISLIAIKRAKLKEIKVWGPEAIGADKAKCGLGGSKTKVVNIRSELQKKCGARVEGTTFDKVSVILDVILDRSSLR